MRVPSCVEKKFSKCFSSASETFRTFEILSLFFQSLHWISFSVQQKKKKKRSHSDIEPLHFSRESYCWSSSTIDAQLDGTRSWAEITINAQQLKSQLSVYSPHSTLSSVTKGRKKHVSCCAEAEQAW